MLNDDNTRYLVGDTQNKFNVWIMPEVTLKEKYDLAIKGAGKEHQPIEDCEVIGLYIPKGGQQKFLEINEDIEFKAPWGEKQTIFSGGYLNITDPKDIYGINEEEFKETYKIV